MTKELHTQPTIQESLPSMGENHVASFERSYNSDDTVYTNAHQLRERWMSFLRQSIDHNRRRAIMRCFVSNDILDQVADLPIEAAIPLGAEHLIWIGQNQHQSISTHRPVRTLPQPSENELSSEFTIDREVTPDDLYPLYELWEQFGSPLEGVQNFIETNLNPIVVIRNVEQRAIGVMIAEAMEFGKWQLVELTELAVSPRHQGQGLASVLIRELARNSIDYFGSNAVLFGEYNLTTNSFRAAARSNQLPAQNHTIDGVLRDHVSIKTGTGNEIMLPWDTEWLHNFLVMYQLGNTVS